MYFNYQGRLKKGSKAVSDFRYFRFRLTDDGGASEYYTSGSTRIYVTNGLFNYKVGPLDGVDFAANAMYIEVSVGESSPDNLLLPRERLVSSPYAIYAASAAYSLAGGTATYAQNSAALGTRAFDAFVSTRAENQTVAGVKTFTSTAVFQQAVAVGQNVITQSSITTPSISVGTITATGKASVGDIESAAGIYVDRGNAAGWDKVATDFTMDNTWRDMSFAGIVPLGAKAICFRVQHAGSGVGAIAYLRKKSTASLWNTGASITPVINVTFFSEVIVSCDADRIIQYKMYEDSVDYRLLVKGWWK
jgi:hypothetical protein